MNFLVPLFYVLCVFCAIIVVVALSFGIMAIQQLFYTMSETRKTHKLRLKTQIELEQKMKGFANLISGNKHG